MSTHTSHHPDKSVNVGLANPPFSWLGKITWKDDLMEYNEAVPKIEKTQEKR